MNREQFIKKWQPGIVTSGGTFKDPQWLNDFFKLLTDEHVRVTESHIKIVKESMKNIKK